MGANVFLSYAMADQALAEGVAKALAHHGVDASVFHLATRPGEDFIAELRDSLQQSDAVVAVLSGEASNSLAVMAELGAAIALDKEVFVIRVDADPLPLSLSNPRIHVIDADGMSTDVIASAIRARLGA